MLEKKCYSRLNFVVISCVNVGEKFLVGEWGISIAKITFYQPWVRFRLGWAVTIGKVNQCLSIFIFDVI